MLEQLKNILSGQYGGSLKMLANAIDACPDDLWLENAGATPYWHNAFHVLFLTDLYLSGSLDGFSPPKPFGFTELNPEGELPVKPWSKREMLSYAAHCSHKAKDIMGTMDATSAVSICDFAWVSMSFLELQFYNIRHIQHHVGQLNLILRQRLNYHAPWVGRVD